MSADHISFARSRFLMVCGFLNLDKSDSAYLWSAFDMVDKDFSGTVRVQEFANTFLCTKPPMQILFNLTFDKYSWTPPVKKFKAAVEHHDDDDTVDFEKLKEEMGKSEDERAEIEERKENERQLKLAEEHERRHRPDYVRFLLFLCFFMSIPSEDMARFVFWLFFEIPNVQPTKETLVDCCDKLWDKKNHNKSWYVGEAKGLLKVVDAGFNAHTFTLSDQRTGGSWTLPYVELRKEITRNLGNKQFWQRVGAGFFYSMGHVEKQLNKLKDLRIRGAPPDPTLKGDRSDGRSNIREFARHYRTYMNMPQESEDDFAGTSCISTVCNVLSAWCSQYAERFKAVAPEIEFDTSMGLGAEGYVRPASRGTLAKFKQQLRERGALPGDSDDDVSVRSGNSRSSHEKETDIERAIRLEQEAEEEAKGTDEAVVPLEYKFRRQLVLPARVLHHKAREMKASSKKILERVELEVISETEIKKNIPQYAALDLDSMPHDDSSLGPTIRTDEDDESSIASLSLAGG